MLSLASLLSSLFAVAWLPWLAFALRRFLDRRPAGDFALLALILGVILLIGEPATILQSGALVAAYSAYRLRTRGLALAAAICAGALLVGAAQIVPAIDHQRDSGRAGGLPYDDVAVQSMKPARPLELLAPNLFGRFNADSVYFWAAGDPIGVPWLFSWYSGLLAAA